MFHYVNERITTERILYESEQCECVSEHNSKLFFFTAPI